MPIPVMSTTMNNFNQEMIRAALPYCLKDTSFPFGKKIQGKVRDTYDLGDQILLVTTDRQTAFDRWLACVPYKGQVLNLISVWWFRHTQALVPNHFIAVPDPHVILAKKCKVFPIEFVVRAYISGSTSTSLWTQYQQGVRNYCGLSFPEGLKKNQKLKAPVLTPTTKEKVHDRPIGPKEIVEEGWMTQKDWDEASAYALQLFQYGSEVAAKQGLILVDTKYEFGKDEEGRILLVDEIHTPDSSRYWLSANYQERMEAGKEPDNIDKEFLRLWFVDHCDPYKDEVLPAAPEALLVTLSARYIQLYEMITGEPFVFEEYSDLMQQRIVRNVEKYL